MIDEPTATDSRRLLKSTRYTPATPLKVELLKRRPSSYVSDCSGLSVSRIASKPIWLVLNGPVVVADANARVDWVKPPNTRSEEHTSELQSLMRSSYAVFCLTHKNTN